MKTVGGTVEEIAKENQSRNRAMARFTAYQRERRLESEDIAVEVTDYPEWRVRRDSPHADDAITLLRAIRIEHQSRAAIPIEKALERVRPLAERQRNRAWELRSAQQRYAERSSPTEMQRATSW